MEEIDLPGEYVIDRKRGKIYLLPPDEPVREIQVSLLGTPLFAFEGCRNVTLQGVTLEYSRGMGVYIEQSEYTKVDSCVIRNLGYVGVSIGRGDMPADDLSDPRHSADLSNPEGVPAVIGNLSSRLYDDRLFDRKAGRHNGSCDANNNSGQAYRVRKGRARNKSLPGRLLPGRHDGYRNIRLCGRFR